MATPANRPSTVVDALPKAELHLHLEGSIRPQTAAELAKRHGSEIPAGAVAARYKYADFTGFLETFKWVTSFLRDPQDYALITRNLCEELLKQNVVYAEITVSAGVMLRRMQNVEANFQAIHETANSVPFSRLRTAWIFDATRQFGGDAAKEVARWAAKLEKSGVIAFGMGGDELSQPAANFRPAFELARSEGLRLVCHAGEIGGPETLRDAIEILGAERIGHGIAAMNDPALAEFLALRRVPIENCLSSNIATGALAIQTKKSAPPLTDHPLPNFLKQGLCVTLSTDDPALFHTDLLSEYAHAASLGLTHAQLLQLAENSIGAAFLPPQDKRALLDTFRAAAKSSGLQ
jgi:aminodeoxyfutalosine deaminase